MNLEKIKNRLSALQSQGQKKEKKEKVDWSQFIWKPKKEGKYVIRIVPSKDKNNPNAPFKEVYIHYGIAKYPIYALTNWGEKDPVVDFVKQLRDVETNDKEERKENWRLSGKLEPKMRIFAPIIVRGEEDKGVRLWEFGKEIYMQLLGIAEDEDYGDYTNVSDGRDFTLEAVPGDIGNGKTGLKSTIRVKPKTCPLSEDKDQVKLWLTEQPDILELQSTYKKDFSSLKEILKNWLNPSTEEETSKSEDKPEDKKEEEPKKPTTSKVNKFEALFEEKK